MAAYLGLSLEQLLLAKPLDAKIISAVSFEDEKRAPVSDIAARYRSAVPIMRW